MLSPKSLFAPGLSLVSHHNHRIQRNAMSASFAPADPATRIGVQTIYLQCFDSSTFSKSPTNNLLTTNKDSKSGKSNLQLLQRRSHLGFNRA